MAISIFSLTQKQGMEMVNMVNCYHVICGVCYRVQEVVMKYIHNIINTGLTIYPNLTHTHKG